MDNAANTDQGRSDKSKGNQRIQSANFGIFSPLLYVIGTILSTSLGFMISNRDSISCKSPVVWAFFSCLGFFFFCFGYVLIFKSHLLFEEEHSVKMEKEWRDHEYEKDKSKKVISLAEFKEQVKNSDSP